MSLLNGIAVTGANLGALSSISNAFFPKQVIVRITELDLEIQIDSASAIDTDTSVNISEHPAEDGKVFIQNISRNPRRLTLQCIFSNVIRLSNIRSVAAATQFASALLIPEVGSVSNIFLNEEDSISQRLTDLREAMDTGLVVQILGLPDQDVFNYVIENISDSLTVQTGPKARAVNIALREAFIVGLESPGSTGGGNFSKVVVSKGSSVSELPSSLSDLGSRGIAA